MTPWTTPCPCCGYHPANCPSWTASNGNYVVIKSGSTNRIDVPDLSVEGDWDAFAEPSPGPRRRELRPLTRGQRWFEHRRARFAPRHDRAPAMQS